jgi:HlyD family secretion protein
MTPASPDSRALILDAAEARFAVQGFDSTTIKEIAGDAGVNSALRYYYFADKEALYHAVVNRLIERLAGEMQGAFAPTDPPDVTLSAFIHRQGRTLDASPRLRKLIGRELIDHDARHAQAAIRHLAASTFERLRTAIIAGQRSGLFRADIDPRFAAISIVGQTAYFHFARPAVEVLLADGKPLPAGTSDAFADHVTDFTLAALAPRPASKGSASKPAAKAAAVKPTAVKTSAGKTTAAKAAPTKLRGRNRNAIALLTFLPLLACADVAPPLEATGTLEFVETDIAATAAGRVARVLVDEGDRVAAGDTLVIMEIPALPAELAQRRASIRRVRAQVDEAVNGPRASEISSAESEVAALSAEAERTAADVVRITPLAAQDMATAQQLDAAKAAAKSTAARRDAAQSQLQLLRDGTRPERIAALRAELAAAEASLAAGEATARDLVLLAPVDGRVLARRAEPGEVLAGGESAMLLAETRRQRVRIFVGQEALPLLTIGQSVTATLDNFPDRPVEGRIIAIATEAEYTPRVALTERERADLLFAVRAEFRDSTEAFKAGLPVTVRLTPVKP